MLTLVAALCAAVAVEPPGTAPARVFDPPQVDAATEPLRQAKRLESIAKLEQLLSQPQPDPTKAELRLRLADLQFDAGQSLLLAGDPSGGDRLGKASILYSAILRDHPGYARCDQAAWGLARIAADFGDFGRARAALQQLPRDYPASSFLPDAAALLAKLPPP